MPFSLLLIARLNKLKCLLTPFFQANLIFLSETGLYPSRAAYSVASKLKCKKIMKIA